MSRSRSRPLVPMVMARPPPLSRGGVGLPRGGGNARGRGANILHRQRNAPRGQRGAARNRRTASQRARSDANMRRLAEDHRREEAKRVAEEKKAQKRKAAADRLDKRANALSNKPANAQLGPDDATLSDLADWGHVFQIWAHDGELLDGPAAVAGELRSMTGKASMATIGEYARRCATFSQALTPQFLVQRMVHLLQEPPPGSLSAGQEAVPEDELQQSVMLYRRMSGGELPKKWDMILQVFLLRLLALNYPRRWGGLSGDMVGKGILGSHTGQAKGVIRRQIAVDMMGGHSESCMIATKAQALVKEVKCGEDINEYLAAFKTPNVLGLLVLIPWEHMVKRNTSGRCITEIPQRCLQWVMGRMLTDDVRPFILKLASVVEDYIRPGMVLDRLARRPTTPDDEGIVSRDDDKEMFGNRLNQALADLELSQLTKWAYHHDPMDALRCVEQQGPAVIYWDVVVPEGGVPDCFSALEVTDSLIDEIANVGAGLPPLEDRPGPEGYDRAWMPIRHRLVVDHGIGTTEIPCRCIRPMDRGPECAGRGDYTLAHLLCGRIP